MKAAAEAAQAALAAKTAAMEAMQTEAAARVKAAEAALIEIKQAMEVMQGVAERQPAAPPAAPTAAGRAEVALAGTARPALQPLTPGAAQKEGPGTHAWLEERARLKKAMSANNAEMRQWTSASETLYKRVGKSGQIVTAPA